jgi:hypothetical protein
MKQVDIDTVEPGVMLYNAAGIPLGVVAILPPNERKQASQEKAPSERRPATQQSRLEARGIVSCGKRGRISQKSAKCDMFDAGELPDMKDYSNWLTKTQAAEVLGVSTKTVEGLTQDMKLQMHMWRRPEGGPKIAVYNPDDVERERSERNPEGHAFVVPSAKSATSEIVSGGAAAAMAPHRSSQNSAMVPADSNVVELLRHLVAASQSSETMRPSELAHKVYLSITEARAYTGLAEKIIQAAAREGKIKRLGRGYNRADLGNL